MPDDTTQAPARPVYVVRPAFDQIHQLHDATGALLNGSELRWAARAVNAFEPMRAALDKVKARITEIGRTLPGDGDAVDKALRMCAAVPVPVEVLRECMAALRAADGATEGR